MDPVTSGQGRVHIGLTFEAKEGRYCRTFTIAGPGRSAGIACRTESGWQIDALEQPGASAQATEYRMAGSALSPQIRAAVEARIEGEAFDAAREMKVIRGGWSRRSEAR